MARHEGCGGRDRMGVRPRMQDSRAQRPVAADRSSRAPEHDSAVTATCSGGTSDVLSAPYRDRNDNPHGGRRHNHGRGAGQAPAAPGPTASVLIPAHNEAATIREVIRACYASGYPLDDVIVVADSCTDETAAIARAAGATIVLETAFADKAGAQNQALPLVRSEVVGGSTGTRCPSRAASR
jgi:hypothetical protein